MGTRIIYTNPAFQPILEAAGLRRYEDFVRGGRGETVADARTSRTCRMEVTTCGAAHEFYLKVYPPRPGARWRPWLGDRAGREAANYRFLSEVCRVPTPPVVCHGVRRVLGGVVDSFLVTEAALGAVSLDRFVAGRWPSPPRTTDPLRESLLAQSVSLVRAMHDHRFVHIDLQWRNLLVVATARSVRMYVIDSSRGGPRRGRVRLAHGRLRDLSSLAKEAERRLSRTERLRWFRVYLGVRRLDALHRAMIRAIARDRASKKNGGGNS